jgi:hypothetical protein
MSTCKKLSRTTSFFNVQIDQKNLENFSRDFERLHCEFASSDIFNECCKFNKTSCEI